MNQDRKKDGEKTNAEKQPHTEAGRREKRVFSFLHTSVSSARAASDQTSPPSPAAILDRRTSRPNDNEHRYLYSVFLDRYQ